ncbi:hypothetical protein GT037_001397 [Alternaria burnsii]|uniref:Major facilitator superfamily (MFS) profile domain-containing protein n=1 Tax=Alternaria burnsii TaxID=1187904 RepID=A0A8H7B8K4_9PLEO|nr:uncharacterized protein GT037_001397 [Alternaria burnsii]KAF7679746.1 hypothetical protein GT037_001397 [Alternaria burnsii]
MNSTQDTEKAENAIVERVDTSPGEGVFDIGDHPKVNIISLILCPSTSLAYLVREFDVGYPDVAPLISYVVLMIGIGSLIWIPTTSVLGKRITLILANIIFLSGCIWGIFATSLNSLLGSRILGGFGASAVQAIGPALIGDVFFERDYSKVVALYTMCLSIGAQMGPLFAGHIALHMGWRWIFKLIAVLIGFNLFTTMALLPETTFIQDGFVGVTAGALDDRISGSISGRNVHKPFLSTLRKGILSWKHPHVHGGGIKQWLRTLIRHLPFIVDPIVLCCAGLWGIVQSWVIVISVCSSQLFAYPPFLFTPAQLGNWTATSMIGVVLAYPIAGPVMDIISHKLSERRGKHQPEYRLYSMVAPFLICSPGLLLFGYTFLRGSSIGPAVGFAMQAAGLTLAPSATISYVIDSYPFYAVEAVASVNLLTHLMSFALSKTAPEWLLRVGEKQLFIDMSIIQWAIFLGLTLPLLLFGQWIRAQTNQVHERIAPRKD